MNTIYPKVVFQGNEDEIREFDLFLINLQGALDNKQGLILCEDDW